MEKKKIYAFDFDGTLTTRDTLLEFIRFARGGRALWCGMLRFSPLLVLMKAGLYPNWRVKEKVFSHFFKGVSIDEMDEFCRNFAREKRHLLRPEGLKMIEKARHEGATVLIVSASVDNWVAPFFENVTVIGTRIEIENNRVSGRFLTKNCYGEEKVNRIHALFPDRENYKLIAFGDSRGDKEMLEEADEAYFRPFR